MTLALGGTDTEESGPTATILPPRITIVPCSIFPLVIVRIVASRMTVTGVAAGGGPPPPALAVGEGAHRHTEHCQCEFSHFDLLPLNWKVPRFVVTVPLIDDPSSVP